MTKLLAPTLASALLFVASVGCGAKSEDIAKDPLANGGDAVAGSDAKQGKKGHRKGKKKQGRRSGARKQDTVCKRVSCTGGQLAKIKPLVEQFREESKLDRAELHAAYAKLGTLYRNNGLGPDRLDPVMDEIDAKHNALTRKAITVLNVIHKELDRGQQFMLADAVAEDGPLRVLDPRMGYAGDRPRFGVLEAASPGTAKEAPGGQEDPAAPPAEAADAPVEADAKPDAPVEADAAPDAAAKAGGGEDPEAPTAIEEGEQPA